MNMEVQSASATSQTDQPARSRSRTTRKRKGPSISLLCEFERYNPRRSPAWRWQLSEKIVARADRSRPGRADVHLGRAVKFQQRLQRCQTPGRLRQLRDADPDLFAALELQQTGGWRRVLVEARLLAAMPASVVASKSGLTPGAVEVFAAMFYDVTECLGARDYILRIVGTPRRAKTDLGFYEQSIKTFGYFMGPLVVEAMTTHLFTDQGAIRQGSVDLTTADGRLATYLRLAVDIRRAGELTLSYMTEILRTLSRLREFAQRAKQAAGANASTFNETAGAKADSHANMDAVVDLLLKAAMPKQPSEDEAARPATNGESEAAA